MTTTVASLELRSYKDALQWLRRPRLAVGGLGILILLVAAAMWHFRSPADTAITMDTVAPILPANEVTAGAQTIRPRISAPSTALIESELSLGVSGIYPARASLGIAPFEIEEPTADAAMTDGIAAPAIAAPIDATPLSKRSTDLNGDGSVNLFDVVRYATHPRETDANADGVSDVRDIIALDADLKAQHTLSSVKAVTSMGIAGEAEPAAVQPRVEERAAISPEVARHTDLNGDGVVNIFDVVLYATNPRTTDANGDGTHDIRDVIAIDASYGLKIRTE